MKKILLILAFGVFSTAAHAVNPRIVSTTGTFFPGGSLSQYVNAERGLVEKAQAFCKEFNEQVETISNINIQLQGDFELNHEGQTAAVTTPHYLYAALVQCRP